MLWPNKVLPCCTTLRKKIAAHLHTNYPIAYAAALKLVPRQISQWGKIRIADGGDTIHAVELVQFSEQCSPRDATFVKVRGVGVLGICRMVLTCLQYTLEVDVNERHRNLPIQLVTRIFFGQVQRFLALEVPPTFPCTHGDAPTTLLLAVINTIKLVAQTAVGMVCYKDVGPVEVIDASRIEGLVGRVEDRDMWVIVERSPVARAIGFTNPDDDEVD